MGSFESNMKQARAEEAFSRALREGRRSRSPLRRLLGRPTRIPVLEEYTAAVPRRTETYRGFREIPLDQIVGTENRKQDFGPGFTPLSRRVAPRWEAVYTLMAAGTLNDAVTVLEMGGRCFVRDGHHRVSAALSLGQAFIPADVTHIASPVQLPSSLSPPAPALFREKAALQERTGLFRHLPEEEFDVRCPSTWKALEEEIFQNNRAWFIRKHQREPRSSAELLDSWYRNLYKNALTHIRRRALKDIFPGQGATDIFIELVNLWNSHTEPDRLWLGEIYDELENRQRKRRFYRAPFQIIRGFFRDVTATAGEEREYFLTASQIRDIRPSFQPPRGSRRFYHRLNRQVFRCLARQMKQELGRAPYIPELTARWHDTIYQPILQEWQALDGAPPPTLPEYYLQQTEDRCTAEK